MEEVLAQIINSILTGGREVILVLGWLLYMVERYYVSPNREKQHRADLEQWRNDYNDFTGKMGETLHSLALTLEVIKDRGSK